MKTLSVLSLILGAALLPGCYTPRMDTRSGAPEVTIHADIDVVKNSLVSHLTDKGWTAINDTAFTLLFEHEGSFGEDMFFGSGWNVHTRERARFTVVKEAGGVRIVVHRFIVTNPGSGYEQLVEVSGVGDQYGLDCIAADIEGRPQPPAPPPPKPVTSPHGNK